MWHIRSSKVKYPTKSTRKSPLKSPNSKQVTAKLGLWNGTTDPFCFCFFLMSLQVLLLSCFFLIIFCCCCCCCFSCRIIHFEIKYIIYLFVYGFMFAYFLQPIRFINSLLSVCFIYLNYNRSDRISCLATFQWQNLFRRICNAYTRGQKNL